MESESRRKKLYENQRNLSPETKRKTTKSPRFSRHERSRENRPSRADKMNDRRKYKRKGRHRDEERPSKDVEIHSRVQKKARLSQDSQPPNESIELNNRRNSHSKEAVNIEINGSVGRHRGSNSKDYGTPRHKEHKNRASKSHERRPSTHLSPKHDRESISIRKSRSKEAVHKEVNEMISIEWHHIRYVDRSTSGNSTSGEVRHVNWCPQYINPDTRGHARGGRTLPHHRCRGCRQLCLHLLGRPGTRRLCLACSGYKTKYIPDWYYHIRCEYCR